MRYIVGIDVGTSGTKTVLYQENGQVLASVSSEYDMAQPQNGWAEQDPDDWWNATKATLQQVLKKSGIDAAGVAGVGLTGQMHGLVMLNKQGNVLRPSIIWCDQRTGAQCEEITRRVGQKRLLDITANPATTGFTASKLLWVRTHEPHIYEKCHKILLPKDYIRYRLTGEFATDVSDASGMQMLDIAHRCWSAEVLDALGIDRGLLADVYESPEITGYVSETAAKLTGLKPGTPVAAGAGDNAAAAVGTGVVREGRAFTTIGSSGVVFAHADKPVVDKKGRVHTFCCAVPGAWHVMGVTQGAGLSLKWFRDVFCQPEIEAAAAMDMDVYDLLTKMAAESPIGANRLVYLPYLMGERTPHLDPDCRGVFFGLSAMHKKQDLIRAVIEGVTYSLKDCLEIIKTMGIGLKSMLACGGGGTSPFWRQMLSDVFESPVSTVATQGPAFGAAILAAVGTGVYASVPQACDALIVPQNPIAPDGTSARQYEKVYRVYRNLYPQLKNSFQELKTIS